MRFIVQTMNRNDNTKMTFGIEPLGHALTSPTNRLRIRCRGLVGELRALVKTLLALLFLLIFFPVHAESDKIPVSLSVLTDTQGHYQLKDIDREMFTPIKSNAYSAGYTRDVHWFKVDIDSRELVNHHFLLEIHPTYLDDLTFYYQTANNDQWVAIQQGDQYPFSFRTIQYRGFVVEIPADAVVQGRHVFIRLATTSSSVFNVAAWQSDRAFQASKDREYFVIGLYLGFLLLLIALTTGVWVYSKDKQLFFYLLYLISSALLIGSVNGVFAQFVFLDIPLISDKLTSFSSAFVFIFASLLYEKVMQINRKNTPVIWWITRFTLLIFLVTPIAIVFNLYAEWMKIAINAMLLVIIVWLMRAIYLWFHKQGSLLLVSANVFTLFGGLAAALSLSGWLDAAFWLINGFQVGTLGTIVSLQWLMIQRVVKLDEARVKAIAKSQALHESLQQQESMLAMLTHELKTPLSVISMTLQSKAPSDRLKENAFNAIGNITDVIDRCVHSQRLRHEKHPLKIWPVDVVLLVTQAIRVKEGAKAIHFSSHVASCLINTDEVYAHLIVTNLLDNALKYGLAETPIEVLITKTDEGCCLAISNRVMPDSLPDADKVFERFYRAQTAYKLSGAGLGLFIVKALTEAISGKIAYQAIDETLVRFQVTFPYSIEVACESK